MLRLAASLAVLLSLAFTSEMVGQSSARTLARDLSVQVSESSPPSPAEDLGFHDGLAPYGSWTTLDPYGEVWVPHMPVGWRPYTTGHWVFSDEVGWTWVADEPWGWATFHYGRWTLDPHLGWAWIPGHVWGPAWVAWRECDDLVGWAPLPPSVRWSAGVGLVYGDPQWRIRLGSPYWSFVPTSHFCHPHVRDVLIVRERVPVVLHESRIVEHGLRLERGRPAARAIAVERIEEASGRRVDRVELRDIVRRNESARRDSMLRRIDDDEARREPIRRDAARRDTVRRGDADRPDARRNAGARPDRPDEPERRKDAVRPGDRGRRDDATLRREPRPERRSSAVRPSRIPERPKAAPRASEVHGRGQPRQTMPPTARPVPSERRPAKVAPPRANPRPPPVAQRRIPQRVPRWQFQPRPERPPEIPADGSRRSSSR